MRKISDYGEVKGKLASSKGSISNCYWMPEDVIRMIGAGQLYEVSATDGFAWIQQNNARNQFFYQTSQGKADSYKCSLPKGMNCVAEIIHLTVPSQRLEAERQILNRLGFQFTDLARMMVKKPEDLNFSTSDNHRIRQANRVDYDIIHMLFTDAFDELTDAIPVEEELCQ